MTDYILKSSLSLIILFGLYWLLLRKEKLFVFNRFFLVLSVIFSLTVPLITIPVNFRITQRAESTITAFEEPLTVTTGLNNNQQPAAIEKPSAINISSALLALYLSGVLLFSVRLLRNIYFMLNRIRNSEKLSLDGYRIILTDDSTGPCCFFNNIFLNRDDYLNGRIEKELLEHEKEHVRQSHTIDVLLLELWKTLYWFNPVYLLYDRAIRINHEYLADSRVISGRSEIKSYAQILLSFVRSKSILSLTSASNYTYTRMRLTMMMRPKSNSAAISARIATTFCSGLALFMLLSFKESDESLTKPAISKTATEFQEKGVRGIALTEGGKPLQLVTIIVSSKPGIPSDIGVQTGADGRFEINNIPEDASLNVSCIGYKNQTIKADFKSEMLIHMIKDPDYRGTVATADFTFLHEGENVRVRMRDDKDLQALIVIDDKISGYKGEVTLKRDDVATGKVLRGKEATDKYGEKGRQGVIEIITIKRAEELGLNTAPPQSVTRQRSPDDYPTFRGADAAGFQEWVAGNISYPAEAGKNKTEGWVSVDFTVNTDGSISNIKSVLSSSPLLTDEVIRAIKSSPSWEPSRNKETARPFASNVTLKFKSPDIIIKDPPLVQVDEMPVYPGGDEEILNLIRKNTRYPDRLKAEKIEGRVIVRFIVSPEGNTEGISVMKGVHPLLDAEALRVTGLIKGWKPGLKNGKAVPVWFMVPVTFSLNPDRASTGSKQN